VPVIPYNTRYYRKLQNAVPAVYDGLAARIKKCVAFLGPTKCAGGFTWE
jgi:hypothetical protein